MAPTQRPPENISAVKPPKLKPPPRVCFSFAAYSKTIIRHLRSLNVDVLPGLTDDEISAVESSLDFSFPPDLRSILQAGLPLGAHFPDWRTGSTHHLRILFNLPLLHLSKNVARNGFWVGSWGPRPKNDVAALSVVKKLSDHAPVLIPVYGNCYLPSTTPNLAGNPVIQIDGNGVKVLSIDVSGIFMRFDRLSNPNGSRILPVWAAKETRRVEFWSEVAERGRRTTTARGPTLGWWSALPDECLTACLDDAFWKLRDGGWSEDEVRDMMNGDDAISDGVGHGIRRVIRRRITDAAQTLSRAGWSREDVEYALDHRESCGCDRNVKRNHDRSACDGERCPSTSCCMGKEEGHQKRGRAGPGRVYEIRLVVLLQTPEPLAILQIARARREREGGIRRKWLWRSHVPLYPEQRSVELRGSLLILSGASPPKPITTMLMSLPSGRRSRIWVLLLALLWLCITYPRAIPTTMTLSHTLICISATRSFLGVQTACLR